MKKLLISIAAVAFLAGCQDRSSTGGTGSNGAANTVAGGNVTVPSSTWKVALVLSDNGTDDDETCDAQDHDDDQGEDHDGQDAPAQAPAQAHGQDADDGCPGDTGNGSNPGTNPGTNPGDQGPSTQSVSSGASAWLWLLLIVIAGAAASTAYVLRRRMKAR